MLILPNQLFNVKNLRKDEDVILYEHPHYFEDYNYNKKKLILHRASMKYYEEYLKNNGIRVKYYTFKQKLPKKIFKLFEPGNKLNILNLSEKCELLDSPNFLLTHDDHEKYRDKTDKFFFNSFYMYGKKVINVIPNIKSMDKENRNNMPKTVKIPKIPDNVKDSEYIDEAKKYVNKYFPNNYGNVDNFIYPVTHKTAKNWLRDFVEKRLKNFGKYQDAMLQNESYLFHSILSTSINIGLLNPLEIIKYIEKVCDLGIPINSYEGYVRQLFWREYQLYCYHYLNFEGENYFKNKTKLSKKWYTGELGIKPVDDCIVKGFDTGYLHHIERLMVIGNFMNLKKIDPDDGFRWFMEFPCDSYEWVMYQNVYDMVFFITGGKTMRRPYISSSNYILKMSNYKKEEWSDEWDDLYYDFLKLNKNKLWKFRYHFRGLKNV